MEKYINFLLNIKLKALNRNGLDSLTYKQLRRVLYETKWLLKVPTNLSVIAQDIENLTIDEIARYLAVNDQQLQKGMEDISRAFEDEDYEIE